MQKYTTITCNRLIIKNYQPTFFLSRENKTRLRAFLVVPKANTDVEDSASWKWTLKAQ